jgi:iron complex transport system substrate-binding protein
MDRSAFALLLISCISLAVTPVIASDYTLEVFGNANMDETIDEDDVAYVEGIIDGTNEGTELADANYDGQIDGEDIAQIELIMRGEEEDLTIIDESGNIVTIKEPVERVVVCHAMFAEVLRSLRAEDRIVGIPSYMADYVVFYPELSKLPKIGGASTPDSEAIVSLNPDIVIVYGTWAENLENDLKNVAPVVRLTYRPFSTTEKDITTLGYIVGKMKEAEELIQFFEQPLSTVQENVSVLSEDEKPRVYSEYTDYRTHAKGSGLHDVLIMAGGINIASDITTDPSGVPFIDPEWVIAQNPDIIVNTPLLISPRWNSP